MAENAYSVITFSGDPETAANSWFGTVKNHSDLGTAKEEFDSIIKMYSNPTRNVIRYMEIRKLIVKDNEFVFVIVDRYIPPPVNMRVLNK